MTIRHRADDVRTHPMFDQNEGDEVVIGMDHTAGFAKAISVARQRAAERDCRQTVRPILWESGLQGAYFAVQDVR